MREVKVGDLVFVKSAKETRNSTAMFWRVHPDFTQGTVIDIRDGYSFRYVTVDIPGRNEFTFAEDEVVVYDSSPRKIEFDDVQIGDLIRATRVDGENSYVKTFRVVKRSPANINVSSEGGLEAVMLWQHETEGNRVNATIELLDRPVAVEKPVLKVGDVVEPDALYEVDTAVVVRYVDETGEVSLGVVVPGEDEIVFPDARVSLGGILRQSRYEIMYIEKESA